MYTTHTQVISLKFVDSPRWQESVKPRISPPEQHWYLQHSHRAAKDLLAVAVGLERHNARHRSQQSQWRRPHVLVPLFLHRQPQ